MNNQQRFYEAALGEFRENGVKFTMDSLAKRLGISKRTLYEMVPSKEQVIRDFIDWIFEDIKAQQKNVFEDPSLGTLERLQKLLLIEPKNREVLEYHKVKELKAVYPKLYQYVQEWLESDWEATVSLIQQAMDEGLIRGCNLVVLQFLLCEIYKQLLQGTMLMEQNISYHEALSEIGTILFEGLKVR